MPDLNPNPKNFEPDPSLIAIKEKGDQDYVPMIDSYGIVWSTRQQSLEIMKFFTRPRKRMLALPILRFLQN